MWKWGIDGNANGKVNQVGNMVMGRGGLTAVRLSLGQTICRRRDEAKQKSGTGQNKPQPHG